MGVNLFYSIFSIFYGLFSIIYGLNFILKKDLEKNKKVYGILLFVSGLIYITIGIILFIVKENFYLELSLLVITILVIILLKLVNKGSKK